MNYVFHNGRATYGRTDDLNFLDPTFTIRRRIRALNHPVQNALDALVQGLEMAVDDNPDVEALDNDQNNNFDDVAQGLEMEADDNPDVEALDNDHNNIFDDLAQGLEMEADDNHDVAALNNNQNNNFDELVQGLEMEVDDNDDVAALDNNQNNNGGIAAVAETHPAGEMIDLPAIVEAAEIFPGIFVYNGLFVLPWDL